MHDAPIACHVSLRLRGNVKIHAPTTENAQQIEARTFRQEAVRSSSVQSELMPAMHTNGFNDNDLRPISLDVCLGVFCFSF